MDQIESNQLTVTANRFVLRDAAGELVLVVNGLPKDGAIVRPDRPSDVQITLVAQDGSQYIAAWRNLLAD